MTDLKALICTAIEISGEICLYKKGRILAIIFSLSEKKMIKYGLKSAYSSWNRLTEDRWSNSYFLYRFIENRRYIRMHNILNIEKKDTSIKDDSSLHVTGKIKFLM